MSLKYCVTIADLAEAIKIQEQILRDFAYNIPDSHKYSSIIQVKRNGQLRSIQAPVLRLKMIQRRILPLLEELYRPNTRIHAYVKGRGLRSNAAPHLAKRFILNTDLVNFFGNINFGRVRGRLLAAPYKLSDAIATTIARLATCNGTLPLGSPISPIISNIICSGLDAALSGLARDHGCFYSRYADDLTFSTNRKTFPRAIAEREPDGTTTSTVPGRELELIVASQGFQINIKKTRLLSTSDRQEVCGVVCNQKLNTLPKLRRQIRASLHAWRKFGYAEAEREWREKYTYRSKSSFKSSLRGKIEFFKHIRGASDPLVGKYADQFNELLLGDKPILYIAERNWRQDLSRTCCCIHSYMNGDSSEMVQGSGFVIAGGYIVTNHHVVMSNSKSFDHIQVEFPSSIRIAIEVEIVATMAAKDLALLQPRDSTWKDVLLKTYCDVSNESADRDDVVWLSGWPNYNDGDDLHLVQGIVIGFSQPDGTRMFRITPNIVFGNSGGAVFDEAGRVIGVATRGSDVAGAPLNVHNGCVPATWIADLVELAS